MGKYKIAVLLATYNGESFLECQLDSLINQTYSDFTVYISDDGSVDGTVNIILKYIEKYPQKFFMLDASSTCKSAKKNFLNLFFNVEADVYFFCDQDDVWFPNHIECLLNSYHVCDTNVPVLIHSDVYITDENLNIISRSFYKKYHIAKKTSRWNYYFIQNNVIGHTMMVNNKLKEILINKRNKVDDFLNYVPMHDWLLACIANVFGQIIFIDERLGYYRQHSKNIVGVTNYFCLKNLVQKIKIYFDERKNSIICLDMIYFFLNVFFKKLSTENQCVLENAFCIFAKKNYRIEKLRFLYKYNFFKDSFLKKIIQILLVWFI